LRKYVSWLVLLFAVSVIFSGCSTNITVEPPGATATTGGTTATPSTAPSAQEPDWGVQTKTTGCKAKGGLQDFACTPGDIIKSATKKQICTPGYAGSVRNVPQSLKNKVYAAYGVKTRKPGQYEVDHLVSLQLGGSNDISNLWPEIDAPKPGFHEKDRVENYLHDQLCKGKMTLKQVQVAIATNWLAVYKSMQQKSSSGSDSDDSE
jgi:uncharacterized protein YceK